MSNRRFEMFEYRQVIYRMRLGESDRVIAKAGLMGRKKAARLRGIAQERGWLEEGPLPDDATLAQVFQIYQGPHPQVSLVQPYEQQITCWHQEGIDGTTIHQALVRNHNFSGSYSSVRRFLQKLESAHPKATTVLDFEPAEAAQVDFGSGPVIQDAFTGERISTFVFVMTLAWSRHLYAELVRDQKVETWLGCHRRAFEFFNGIPTRLIIDNPKCAITRACYRDPQVQRSYAELAEGYGFLISPCPPRDPKKKGRVESGVKYVKRSFLPLRTFRCVSDGNRQLKEWTLGEAGNRIHGTTRQRPLTAFVQTERQLLKPLPDVPPELATWAKVKVHGNCHVQFERTFYSAPFRLVHRELWLKATETNVKLFYNLELVAIHPRLRIPGARSTVPEHMPPEALAFRMQDPQWCLKQAQQVGPSCTALIETLFADRVLDNLRAAQGIISLGKRFGPQRLEVACKRALAYDNPRYRTVKVILTKGLDQLAEETLTPEALPEAYSGKGRFCRKDRSLFFQ